MIKLKNVAHIKNVKRKYFIKNTIMSGTNTFLIHPAVWEAVKDKAEKVQPRINDFITASYTNHDTKNKLKQNKRGQNVIII